MILLPTLSALRNSVLAVPPRGGVVIPTMLNVEKLSLSPSTAVGTQVKVSDGFVVSGAGDENGLYVQGGTAFGKNYYNLAGTKNDPNVSTISLVWWADGEWDLTDENGDPVAYSFDDVAEPWLATSWVLYPVVTAHPAIQQLAAPSSAQGGVFVSGGTQDGIYTPAETATKMWTLLGQSHDGGSNNGAYSVVRVDSTSGYFSGFFTATSAKFVIGDDQGESDDPLYYSLSNVATPDLASNWKNASDDSPASISVVSVTAGQIAAGIKFGSDSYTVTTPVNGRNAYHDVLGVAPDFTFNGTIWTDGTHNGTGAPAFPWNVTGITITQDNVAAEANWSNV